MTQLRWVVLALSVASTMRAPAQVHYDPSPTAIVRLASGTLQGAEPAAGMRAYLGIPSEAADRLAVLAAAAAV